MARVASGYATLQCVLIAIAAWAALALLSIVLTLSLWAGWMRLG